MTRIMWVTGLSLAACGADPVPEAEPDSAVHSAATTPTIDTTSFDAFGFPGTVAYDGASWAVQGAPFWTEFRDTDGSCEASTRYTLWVVAEGASWTLSVVVPNGTEPGPHPVAERTTLEVSEENYAMFGPALGPGAWISGGSVWVDGRDGSERVGLRFEGGEACTPAGCSPMTGPLVATLDEPWPGPMWLEQGSWPWSAELTGPGGGPLCPEP